MRVQREWQVIRLQNQGFLVTQNFALYIKYISANKCNDLAQYINLWCLMSAEFESNQHFGNLTNFKNPIFNFYFIIKYKKKRDSTIETVIKFTS